MPSRRVVLAVAAVLVLVGLSVPVSEAQAPATARLAGTVTADEDGRPLEGICVTVYSISSDGFHWLRRAEATTGPEGTYGVDVAPEPHVVEFSDCAGLHDRAAEFFDDVTSFRDASRLTPSAGETLEGIDAGLAVSSHIQGTVTSGADGSPLEGICVTAIRPLFEVGNPPEVRTGPDGTYDIGGLSEGEHAVRFRQCTGPRDHVGEYYPGVVDEKHVTDAPRFDVPRAGTVTGIDAGLTPAGRITGTVTADDTGAPLAGVCVRDYDNHGIDDRRVDTGVDGRYVLGPFPTGNYRIQFFDCHRSPDRYQDEWYDDSGNVNVVTWVSVTAGEVTPSVDAGLEPLCQGRRVTVDLAEGESPTDERDVIRGTRGRDVIHAGGGSDVVCALGGWDVVKGGPGADDIRGGWGRDQLRGNADGDHLLGGPGLDRCGGGVGPDDRVTLCERVSGVP